MKRIFLVSLALAIPAAIPAAPAYACSFSWKKGQSPGDVKRSPKNKKVKGTFKLEKIVGEDSDGKERVYYASGDWPGTIYEARVVGTITSESGKKWKTINEVMPEATEDQCLDYIAGQFPVPEADAQGTFWMEIATRRGRHRIVIWEGQYLPRPDQSEMKD